MFKGNVYCARWRYEGKKRKAWGVRYRIDGGPLVRKVVADTKAGAEAELDRLKADHQQNLLGVSEGKTLAELVPRFLAQKDTQGRDLNTYRARLSNLVPVFGAMPLEAIDTEAIDAYIQARRTAGVDNATINRDLGVLRHMLRLAVRKWRWLRREPYFEMLPEHGPRDLELTEAEEAALHAACSEALWTLIQAGIFTGMRQGELLALTWPRVDLGRRVLNFPPTKRGRKREIPMNEPLYYLLARLWGEASRNGQGAPDRVFLRPDGMPWSKWTVESHLGKALAAAGIHTPLVFHDLRHTCASRLNRQGVPEANIQQLLGHTTAKTTRGYITIQTEDLRRSLNLLASRNNAELETTTQRGIANPL